MRATTLLRILLALKHTRVTGVRFGPTGIEVDVAPTTRVPFCSDCMCRARRIYDRRRREWRHLDATGMEVTLSYEQRRVDCWRCGVVVELVPWAEPGSRFTRDFEDQVAYLAQVMDQTTVCNTMRIAWVTVGEIVERVVARLGPADRLEGLEHIGIDELSYRRHHEYITTIVDHVARKVVWAAPGKNAATVKRFFKNLGRKRAAKLKTVTMDMSAAYIEAVEKGASQAHIVFDHFHVLRMAQDALDKVRREQVALLAGTDDGKSLKKARWALLKNPWNMNAVERNKLAEVQRDNRPLFRAYLLKESLADILDRRQVTVVRDKLDRWDELGRAFSPRAFQEARSSCPAAPGGPQLNGGNSNRSGTTEYGRNRKTDNAQAIGLLREGSAEVPSSVPNMHIVANGEAVLHTWVVAGAPSTEVHSIDGAGRCKIRLQPNTPIVG